MNPLARPLLLKRGHLWLQSRSVLLMRIYLLLAVVLTVSYPFLSLLPSAPESVLKLYGLTESSYRLVLLPIVVLLVIIWLAAFYGSWKIKKYSSLIRNTNDGRAINIISNGFLILSISLPITSVINSISALIERSHVHWIPTLTIFNNYLGLVLMAVAFAVIALGAEDLSNLISNKINPWPQKFWVLAFITFSTLYTYFIVIQPSASVARKIYFIPSWLLLISIVIPYLYIWYRGLHAGYAIYQYQQKIRGRVYKSALNYLAAGIVFVIGGSIATRTITTLSTKLTALKLTPILLIIYALLALIGIGYLLITIGARRLQKIEEV